MRMKCASYALVFSSSVLYTWCRLASNDTCIFWRKTREKKIACSETDAKKKRRTFFFFFSRRKKLRHTMPHHGPHGPPVRGEKTWNLRGKCVPAQHFTVPGTPGYLFHALVCNIVQRQSAVHSYVRNRLNQAFSFCHTRSFRSDFAYNMLHELRSVATKACLPIESPAPKVHVRGIALRNTYE